MKKKYFLIIFLCVLGLYSCKKNPDTVATPQVDVYISGGEYNGNQYVAKYWKNGIPVILSDGSTETYTEGIAVSGNDLYVAGQEYKGSSEYAKYWKNGIPVVLSIPDLHQIAINKILHLQHCPFH